MTLALTAAGLQTQTQDQIVAEMVAKLRATFGNNLNTSATSIMGQLVNIVSELRSLDQQTLLAVYRSFDPNTAEGVALDRLATLTGSTRNGATSSVVQGFLTFSGIATVNDGDLIENTDNSTQWQAINGPYTSAGPFPETIAATFQAVDTGPILANANTNWALVTVIAGLDGFANPADDAALGRDQETDPDFRVRRQIELFSQNVGGLAAIRAVVSRVDGVETVTSSWRLNPHRPRSIYKTRSRTRYGRPPGQAANHTGPITRSPWRTRRANPKPSDSTSWIKWTFS